DAMLDFLASPRAAAMAGQALMTRPAQAVGGFAFDQLRKFRQAIGAESWEEKWARERHCRIIQLNNLALRWLRIREAAAFVGNGRLVAQAEHQRALLRKLRDEIYDKIDSKLGLAALPDTVDVRVCQQGDAQAAKPLAGWPLVVAVGPEPLGVFPILTLLAFGGVTLVIDSLASLLKFFEDEEVRVAEADAKAVASLKEALSSSDPAVRAAAAQMLGGLAESRKVSAEIRKTQASNAKIWWAVGGAALVGVGLLAWRHRARLKAAAEKAGRRIQGKLRGAGR
ncbi:MAG: hypothetical protein KC620_26115, partial [Myxococcales bacterium]|nr:hypothetical protein [Myxococcales bacterium]